MKTITSIHDLKILAKKRLPKIFYDYIDSGSWTESTYKANSCDFKKIKFKQRVAKNVENRSLSSIMLGEMVSMPVALAPTGLTGMFYADGEILAAQAAEQFGVPFVLSTMSICSIEDIADNTNKPFWFQLYVMRDRKFMERLIDRAKDAGCSTLVVTLDLQIMAQRHKDLKNGLTIPLKITPSNFLNLISKIQWCFNMLQTRRHSFGNIIGHVDNINNMKSLSEWNAQQFDPTLNWDDIKWIRKRWGGKIIVKGIMSVEDTRLAMNAGVDGIVISNHGGRQLDDTPSTISILQEIVEVVKNNIEIHIDGGISSGQDVLKCLAFGAQGVYIGRSYLYGLSAMGKLGVQKSLEIIYKEMDTTMALCGVTSIEQLDKRIIY